MFCDELVMFHDPVWEGWAPLRSSCGRCSPATAADRGSSHGTPERKDGISDIIYVLVLVEYVEKSKKCHSIVSYLLLPITLYSFLECVCLCFFSLPGTASVPSGVLPSSSPGRYRADPIVRSSPSACPSTPTPPQSQGLIGGSLHCSD